MFSPEHIKNKALTIRKLQGKISPSDQSIEKKKNN